MVCPNCGKKNKDSSRYCSQCGMDLHNYSGSVHQSSDRFPLLAMVVILFMMSCLIAVMIFFIWYRRHDGTQKVVKTETAAPNNNQNNEKNQPDTEAVTQATTEVTTEEATKASVAQTEADRNQTQYSPPATTAAKYDTDSSSYNYYIISGSDSRYISRSELTGLSKKELRLALNEIYARKGRMFKDDELQAYFDSQSWYQPRIAASDFNESILNEYERANIDTIAAYQSEKGYR